ncbi:MAG: hypothetical protein DME92_05370 [Verrucomicrobia bacterium]|nr:MAG: hypothetical protein DME92_05370 [Verrucomicrobiota bacterium]
MLLLKSLRIGFIGLVLFTASAWAASSVLEGIVKDARGHSVEGADIRIETKNGGRLLTTVKTDVNGRYILEGLPAGNYRVTLVVKGAVKTSINNTTLESGEPTQLNFDLAAAPASRATATAASTSYGSAVKNCNGPFTAKTSRGAANFGASPSTNFSTAAWAAIVLDRLKNGLQTFRTL